MAKFPPVMATISTPIIATTIFRMRLRASTTAALARGMATSQNLRIMLSAKPAILPNVRQMHKSANLFQQSTTQLDEATRQRIDGFVRSAPVVVFMKGTQLEPMCGFSRNVKLVLDLHRVPFKDYNVLEDEQLRQGIKEYSEWPTIPQVYVNGKFVGGCDIVVQMHKDGEIAKFFDDEGIPSRFSEKFPPPKGEKEED